MGNRRDESTLERVCVIAAKLPGCTFAPQRLLELYPALDTLADSRVADLYLVAACLGQDSVAVAEFYRRFEAEILAIGRRTLGDNEADDFGQRMLARFLVGTKKGPGCLGQYTGRGSLGGFVLMSTSRFAIDVQRQRSTWSEAPAEIGDLVVAEDDPEGQLVDAETKSVITKALSEILGKLRPIERRALRMRYLMGFSLARTAQALQIREPSVSRMVRRSRDSIRAYVQQEVAATHGGVQILQVTSVERSIASWFRSQRDPAGRPTSD